MVIKFHCSHTCWWICIFPGDTSNNFDYNFKHQTAHTNEMIEVFIFYLGFEDVALLMPFSTESFI